MDFGPQRGFLLFTLFSLYCPTRHTGLKIFARIFQIKQVKAAKKSLAGAVYKYEKLTNRKLGDLKMPSLEDIFTTFGIMCYHF